MKRTLLLLAISLLFTAMGNAQTKRPVGKTTKTTTKASPPMPAPPSANGTFKFYYSKEKTGFFNVNDGKNYVVITAEGKTTSEIKSSIMSTLSGMYTNPAKVISTLGDNIINVTAYASDAFMRPFLDSFNHYSFTYNIKIEIKDGKIKIDSPSFSGIIKQNIFKGRTIDTDYVTTDKMYDDLYFSKEIDHLKEQEKVENIINSHITKIVSGLSSNSDW